MQRKALPWFFLLGILFSFSEAQAGPIPEISSNVSAIDFGSRVVGQLADPETIILTNVGEADLIFQDNKFIGEATADFILTMDFCSFQILPPGESCQIQISMRPTELGERTAQFAVENNDPAEPLLLIDLVGEGTGSGGCALMKPQVFRKTHAAMSWKRLLDSSKK